MPRPSNERDGACICDYNPETTDGPQEDCPFHGRPYAYWVERAADLQSRLACVAEATYWDRPYDERLAAIRGMCDLTTNGLTPIETKGI